MYHFRHIYAPTRAWGVASLVAAVFLLVAVVSALGQETDTEIRIGGANVERLLGQYWRTPRVRAELESQKVSKEYRQKQMDLTRLEQEEADQRFWFFSRKKESEKIQEERSELQAMAVKETERARKHEGEAVDELMMDIRKATETTADRRQLSVVFDTNSPYILFFNPNSENSSDITEEVMNALNASQFDQTR